MTSHLWFSYLHLTDDNNAEHLFHVLISIYTYNTDIYIFSEMSVNIFCPFQLNSFLFNVEFLDSFLYILDINSLLDLRNIFPAIQPLMIFLLIKFFIKQKFYILMRSSLSIFQFLWIELCGGVRQRLGPYFRSWKSFSQCSFQKFIFYFKSTLFILGLSNYIRQF